MPRRTRPTRQTRRRLPTLDVVEAADHDAYTERIARRLDRRAPVKDQAVDVEADHVEGAAPDAATTSTRGRR
ncbi:hypothetical protein [Kineococcus rhizosphaerae]|uniref:Uncharacterized protein n=1 Tax=Kineococcus rhizosphaerae TaxID=559628 RepID=A0A2T0QLM4_9ACTN|nr:hypothetical protein [Kineococcus rhizosphaerae]PRY05394.1 hypothetical protein CLV37_1396 [Kineococcus rhizosphaerae]